MLIKIKIKIDNKKNGLIEMKNESKNMQNIKERIKIINEYNIININRKKKRNNENIGNINKLFGERFVRNNKNNCKIVINGKEKELVSFYDIERLEENEILEIKLKGINI